MAGVSQGHAKGPMAYVCGYAQPGSYIAGTCRDSFGVTQHDKCYAAGRSAQGGLAQAAQVRTCDTQPLTSAATADMRGETAELSAAINEAATASARRFNGAGDYVHVPKLGSYCDLTIDTWLRWAPNFMTPGPDGMVNHPIMNEDNWNTGDLHYQIYNGEFGFDVNGNGDYTYGWQEMRPSTWYYITAIYSCADHLYELQVSTPATEPNGQLTKVVDEPYDPSRHSSTTAKWPMITLDSPRIGAWYLSNSQYGSGAAGTYDTQIQRSMDGDIFNFKVWSYQNRQCHHCGHCYAAGTAGLELMYTFSDDRNPAVPDLSGNGRDGTAICERGPPGQRTTGGDCSQNGQAPPNVHCALPGFGGYFDGEADYVQLPALARSDGMGAMYPEIQIDVWVKFHCTTGEHPVMNENGWSTGDVHYQIYDSVFGFDINGNGDYAFQWQPEPMVW